MLIICRLAARTGRPASFQRARKSWYELHTGDYSRGLRKTGATFLARLGYSARNVTARIDLCRAPCRHAACHPRHARQQSDHAEIGDGVESRHTERQRDEDLARSHRCAEPDYQAKTVIPWRITSARMSPGVAPILSRRLYWLLRWVAENKKVLLEAFTCLYQLPCAISRESQCPINPYRASEISLTPQSRLG